MSLRFDIISLSRAWNDGGVGWIQQTFWLFTHRMWFTLYDSVRCVGVSVQTLRRLLLRPADVTVRTRTIVKIDLIVSDMVLLSKLLNGIYKLCLIFKICPFFFFFLLSLISEAAINQSLPIYQPTVERRMTRRISCESAARSGTRTRARKIHS